MKITMMTVLFATMAVGLWNSRPAKAEVDCLLSSSNSDVCLRMRHIRSHVLMMEHKMMTMNPEPAYEYFEAASVSMDQLVLGLVRSMSTNAHLDALEDLHLTLFQIRRHAAQESVDTFVYANQLGDACKACHTRIPAGGDNGETLFAMPWADVTTSCREAGKNPYLCNQMHSLAKNLQFFRTGERLGLVNYQAAEQVAGEIQRVASILAQMVTPVHPGGNNALVTLAEQAQQVKAMAEERHPETVLMAPRLIDSCKNCHASIDQ